MFDDVVGTATTGPTGINITLSPGSVDALAVLDTDAQTVNVKMTVSGTVIYNRSQSANIGGKAITDWSRYFFEPIGRVTTLLFLDLPSYPTATIAIAIKGNDPSGPVSCGTLVVGRQLDVGTTEASPTLEFVDYSVTNTDQFGATSVVPRAFARKMTTRSRIEGQQVDYVFSEIVKVRATPVVWIGDDGFDAMKIYGFVKQFSIDVAYETEAYCSLTVQGLV